MEKVNTTSTTWVELEVMLSTRWPQAWWWWLRPLIPALGRQKQTASQNLEFEANLVSWRTARPTEDPVSKETKGGLFFVQPVPVGEFGCLWWQFYVMGLGKIAATELGNKNKTTKLSIGSRESQHVWLYNFKSGIVTLNIKHWVSLIACGVYEAQV